MYKVFLDMDSTLNDFTAGYVSYYNKLYGANVSLQKEDLYQYEISKCIPDITNEEAKNRKYEIFATKNYWIDIPPQDYAIEATKWIYNNFDTYILTAPWMHHIPSIEEKIRWVEFYFPFFDITKIVFTMHKDIIHPQSILIDDKPSNLEEFPGKTIAFDYPFNKDIKVDGRITHWREAKDVLDAYL